MNKKWPKKVFPTNGGDWYVLVTSRMAVDLFPEKHTFRAMMMILQIGYTCKGRNFSTPENSRNCWEVDKTHISRAKVKLKEAGLLTEIYQDNQGMKRRYRLTDKAMEYHSPDKRQCQNE